MSKKVNRALSILGAVKSAEEQSKFSSKQSEFHQEQLSILQESKKCGHQERSCFSERQLEELAYLIRESVGAHLKYKMASQNMEIVEELTDKLNYLISTGQLPNPSAAEIALWKAGKR